MRNCLLLLGVFLPCTALAQVVVSGIVRNHAGDNLAFANVLVLPDSAVALTAADGTFSKNLSRQENTFVISFIGYQTMIRKVITVRDTTLVFLMAEETKELREIVIDSDRYIQEELLRSTRSGTNTLSPKDINGIPALMGEADVIKTLQLLPGTTRGLEGSSDLFVRGGAADQNLVLLDGAPIYNTSHLFGFLSVFNPDILNKVEAINGGFPAEFGGRLSSILNVNTINEIPDRTHVSADVGLIASRFFVDQPILKNKMSVWLGGRRTYIDQVMKSVGEELPYFFYDLNGKIMLRPSVNDIIEVSHYSGEDILDLFRDRNNDGRGFLTTYTSGNSTQALKWTRANILGWKSDLRFTRSSYEYEIKNIFEENSLIAYSDIEDLGADLSFQKDSILNNASVKTGISWIQHRVSPNVINSTGTIAELLESSSSGGKITHEISWFAQHEWSLTNRWRINNGIRLSSGIVSGKTYFVPEPRISARYELSRNRALKFSYSRMAQYIHRISNSAVSTPTDVWYPVTERIAPQTSHQLSTAWQRVMPSRKLFFSAEAYYKHMKKLVGYEEGTNLFFNTDFESKLIQGDGKAYGFELLVRKDAGKFTGWISYTLSWSWRRYDQVNDGAWFHARYDRRHNGAIVAQYALSKRWGASIVWEFISGARFTPVIGQYTVIAPTLTGMDLIPIYSQINGVKLADTHRLDAGIKFRSKPGKKFQWQWFAGVYNAYNRANPIGIFVETEADGSLKYSQPGLFGLLPFISYGFKL